MLAVVSTERLTCVSRLKRIRTTTGPEMTPGQATSCQSCYQRNQPTIEKCCTSLQAVIQIPPRLMQTKMTSTRTTALKRPVSGLKLRQCGTNTGDYVTNWMQHRYSPHNVTPRSVRHPNKKPRSKHRYGGGRD